MKSPNLHTTGYGWGAAALSGLLLACSFPPISFPLVICFALMPLLRRWHAGVSGRTLFVEGYVAFQAAFLIAFSWPLRHAFPATALASLTGVILIPMTMALPFALSLPIKRRLGSLHGWVALVGSYLAMEAFWLHGPFPMPSALLGHALAPVLWLNQFADVTGVAGLTLWVLAINIAGFHTWNTPAQRPIALAAIALLIAVPAGYSAHRTVLLEAPAPRTLPVLTIQPAEPATAWTNAADPSRPDRLLALTDTFLSADTSMPPLIIWPETAIPLFDTPAEEEAAIRGIRDWIDAQGAALLAGAITRSPDSADPSVAFANSALFFSREDMHAGQYDKNLLVPFAERVPFENLYRRLRLLRVDAGGVAGYQPGKTQPLFDVAGVPFGVMICFESLFGTHARSYARNGVAFIAVLANIGWWGPSFAPTQYLAFSRLRAIETRKAVVVVTVSGPSALIEPSGRMHSLGSWMERGGRVSHIPLHAEETVYTRWGDWLFAVALFATLAVLVRFAWISYRSRLRQG